MTQWLTSQLERIGEGKHPVSFREHIVLLGWSAADDAEGRGARWTAGTLRGTECRSRKGSKPASERCSSDPTTDSSPSPNGPCSR